MYKVAALIVAITFAIFLLSKVGESKKEEKTPAVAAATPPPDVKKTATPAIAAMELSAGKKLETAGTLVRSFFKNWQYSRFDEMHAQTVNSRREAFFVQSLKRSPINWQHLNIISEKHQGDDWDVDLSLEVTNIESAFAAFIVNTMAPPGNDSDHIFRFTPKFLKIEKFMTVRQTWHIVSLDNKVLIDLGAGNSRVDRNSNIMNYVLDAGQIEDAPIRSANGWTTNQQAALSSHWLAEAMVNTHTPVESATKIMTDARGLVEPAISRLADLIKTLKATASPDEPVEIPSSTTFQ